MTSPSERPVGRVAAAVDDRLRIGYFWPTSRTVIPTASVASRNPDALALDEQLRLAGELEVAGFDFGLLSDAYGVASDASSRIGHHDSSIHAILWAVAILRHTTRLGVVSTMHTTFLSIPELAQLGAQLDHIGGAHWGWNITTGYRPEEPKLFGGDGLADHDTRYDMAQESLEAVQAYWADTESFHDYVGAHRTSSGVMPGPPPVRRPSPVIVNAGASDRGERFAAECCDYLFTLGVEPSDVREVSHRVHEIAAKRGRDPRLPRVIASTYCLLGDDQSAAEDEWLAIDESIRASEAAQKMASVASRDSKRKIGRALVGTPEHVADLIVDRYHEYGYRGLMLMVPYWSEGETARFGRMFECLKTVGVWLPSAERESLW